MDEREQRVWRYLLEHRQATAEETAENTGTSVEYVQGLIARIGSPNWREEVQKGDKAWTSSP